EQGGVAVLAVAPGLQPQPDPAVQGEHPLRPARVEHGGAGGDVAGGAGPVQRVRVGAKVLQVGAAQPLLAGVRGRPGGQLGAGGVGQAHAPSRGPLSGPPFPGPPSPSSGPRSSRPSVNWEMSRSSWSSPALPPETNPSGSSRSEPEGIRSGCSHSASRPSLPRA